jgi:signal transduction histidine kinase
MKQRFVYFRGMWLKISFIISALMVCMCGYADTISVAGLKDELKSAKSDTAKIRLYFALNEHSETSKQKISFAELALTVAGKANDSANMSKASFRISDICLAEEYFTRAVSYALNAEKYLPKIQRGTMVEVNVLDRLGDLYTFQSLYHQAIACYDKVEKIVSQLDDEHLLYNVLIDKALVYKEMGDLDNALNLYQSALSGYEQLQDILKIEVVYHNMAEIYRDLGFPDKQLEYLMKHLKLAETLGSSTILTLSYLRMIRFYNIRGELDMAEEYLQLLQEIPDEDYDNRYFDENNYSRANRYQILADLYFNMGNKVVAFEYQYKTLNLVNNEGLPKRIAMTHEKIANHYLIENRLDSACYHANLAYTIASGLENKRLQATSGYRLAQYYALVKDYPSAIKYGKIAFDRASETHYLSMSRDAAKLLSACYESIHQLEGAIVYMREYHHLADSLNTLEDDRKIAYLTSQREYQKKEDSYHAQLAMQNQKIHSQKWVNLLMICVLSLFITLAFSSWKNARAKQQANLVLQEHKEELETYNEELFATNEELSATNDQLNSAQIELEQHREHLEELVNEKTAELLTALWRAQEADKLKSAFFANMSHEVRTPLNAILGFLQFIHDPDIEIERREEMIDLINANANQLLTMITDIVTLSKIDSGLLELIPSRVKISDILENVSTETRRMIKYTDKALDLVVKNYLPERLRTVMVDDRQIVQILLHLTDNAIKFSRKGLILIGCKQSEDPVLLHFWVEDTGVGISEEHKELIFQRFWKHDDPTQAYRGLGIGLSLCEHLVHLMGGTFRVESMPELGSTFSFTVRYEAIQCS